MIRTVFYLALGLLDAAGLFFAFINRILSYLRRPQLKAILTLNGLGSLAALFTGLALAGGQRGRRAILAVLGVLTAAEAHYRWTTRRLRGASPVYRCGRPVSLLRPVTTADLVVSRYALPLPGCRLTELPPFYGLAGGPIPRLRIAHLSDLHLNDHLPAAFYRGAIEQVIAAGPDLVFFTGDFVTNLEGLRKFPEIISGLESRLGVFAIFGNHDYWAGAEEIAGAVRAAGIELLGNGWRRLSDGELNLLIVGCEEPWSPSRLILPQKGPGELALVLSHSADQVYRFSRLGAAAQFSGHYHAGQFQIPGFGPLLVPSRYGRRFHHGHFVVGETHLFVSAGMGSSHPALRLYCPPDVFIVDFYKEC